MAKNIYVFLAEGFEEIEAVTTIDLLRRAELPTHIVAVGDSPRVTGAHGIVIQGDVLVDEVYSADVHALVLPGGLPGVTNLKASAKLQQLLEDAAQTGKWLAAICAAPSILGERGYLEGREATAYPGFEQYLTGAAPQPLGVVRSGNIITGRSAGSTVDFALELIKAIEGEDKAAEVARAIVYQR